MMVMGLAAVGAMYYMWLKMPGYKKCPAGRRKAMARYRESLRRVLRDPKFRGDREARREARLQLRLTRKRPKVVK